MLKRGSLFFEKSCKQWIAAHYVNGKRIQKGSKSKEVCEQWLIDNMPPLCQPNKMQSCTNAYSRLHHLIRGKTLKSKIIGCTYLHLKEYIESQFEEGWTWDNYGRVWTVDHIVPLAKAFDTSPDLFVKAQHWTNLRPMLKERNLKNRKD